MRPPSMQAVSSPASVIPITGIGSSSRAPRSPVSYETAMTTASHPSACCATSAMVECSAMACSLRVPTTRAPKVPVTATMSVPGEADALASPATFSVTTSDVLELTTSMRIPGSRAAAFPALGENRLEVDVAALGLIQIERTFHMLQMLEHERSGALAFVQLDCIGDLAVFVERTGGNIRRVVEDDDQAGQRFELAHRARQEGVAGLLGDDLVKFPRQPDDRLPIIRGACGRFERDVRPQLRDLRCCRRCAQQPYQLGLDQASRREDLAGFRDGRTADVGAAVRHDRDDAVVREPRERLANLGPADAEHARQPLFHQLGAGRQPVREDRAQHLLVDRVDARRWRLSPRLCRLALAPSAGILAALELAVIVGAFHGRGTVR